jgi:hypothetical protein
VLCCQFKLFNQLENSICRPRGDSVHHSAKTSFYQQIILWALEITNLLVVGRRCWHFVLTMNSVAVVMGKPEVLPIASGLVAMSSWGRGRNDFGGNKDGQKRTVLCCQFKVFN